MKFKVLTDSMKTAIIDSSHIQMFTRETNVTCTEPGKTLLLDEIVLPCGYVYLISQTCDDLWEHYSEGL